MGNHVMNDVEQQLRQAAQVLRGYGCIVRLQTFYDKPYLMIAGGLRVRPSLYEEDSPYPETVPLLLGWSEIALKGRMWIGRTQVAQVFAVLEQSWDLSTVVRTMGWFHFLYTKFDPPYYFGSVIFRLQRAGFDVQLTDAGFITRPDLLVSLTTNPIPTLEIKYVSPHWVLQTLFPGHSETIAVFPSLRDAIARLGVTLGLPENGTGSLLWASEPMYKRLLFDFNGTAYTILKRMTGQDFGDDVEAWRTWLQEHGKL
jgi:hypothetical protein